MPFDPVDPKQNFPALERGIQMYWQEEDIFKRSIHLRTGREGSHPGDVLNGMAGAEKEQSFSFYDGPPFATGLPHYGHLLAGTIKDVIPRFQTMRGKRVERRFGWDCHGLPIENIIEKEHGIKTKKEIEEMGVKAFNDLCRGAVQRFTKEWRAVVERMGRFVDMDWDYRTMDPDYMESIWWVIKSLSEKKLIYEGHKPMHVCPRCQTPLSNFEVTQGYKDITDLSVTVKFALKDEPGTFILAWTTTPWTLPGNLLLAVHPALPYVRVKMEGATYIVAKARLEHVFKDKEHEVLGKEFPGKQLLGKVYEPLFPYYTEEYSKNAFKVVEGADFVTTENGTGVVHIAMGFGEDDYNVGKREKLTLLQHVGMDGKFKKEVTDFAGLDVKPIDDPTKTDRKVAEWLEKSGRLFSKENYKHSYPHCWRCDSPLLNYATSSWFVAVEKIKKQMLAANATTHWVPSHIRDGRFGNWLSNARDWAVSRNRYWGTPLPIWRAPDSKELEVIGSRDELMRKKSIRFTKVTVLRHGESEGNVAPIYQGKEPGTDLTARGKTQAKTTGTFLKKQKVDIIYCSPLARTRQTAEAVAKATGAKVIVDERLREVEFGDYEGKSVDFSDLTFVKARRAHKLQTGQVESIYHFPGMETWSQVQARVKDFCEKVLPRHRSEHVVVVTHADPALNFKHFFTKEAPAKLCNQPYPNFAEPVSFFWDHDAQSELDLHKETVDPMQWPSGEGTMTVTLVRHGQSEMNAQNICQGQEGDTSLTQKGCDQAKKAAALLKKKKFDCIIASDLKRTRETAEEIAKELGMTITEFNPLFRERKMGQWMGKDLDAILKDHPLVTESGEFGIHHETPPKGESLSQFLRRAEEGYLYLLQKYAGKNVMVVTHGGFIQAFKAVAENSTYIEALKKVPQNCEPTDFSLSPMAKRIPEVLDCWFESGSMPYAQNHFPFKFTAQGDMPPGFPADFIAEGIDQTRGWFYTLMVLSSALYGKPAFQHCIVNGTVLAEDGRKMSKRLKNYPEPLEVVERHGADAVRFALMSSPAVRGEDLRFSEKYVEDIVRSVILPLWNTYSFFVTYANAAKWEPVTTRRHSPHSLDMWLRAEVQDLTNRMTTQLEAFDLSATCAELHDTIDALTNWYVRLSRKRFGASSTNERQEEARDAIATLYDALITFSQLLAPFCPFIADAIYVNLVSDDHGSIHLTDWPETRELTKAEEQLLAKTRLLRVITGLGLQIRGEKKIRLRQPLAKMTIAIPAALLPKGGISDEELQLVREEINVQTIDLVDDPGSIAERYAQVDARKVGPRLGSRVQEVIQAGKRGEFTVHDDGRVTILNEDLAADEVKVMYRGREGEDVAAEKGIVASLDTRITPELELQGKARELIRSIQQLRKDSGLTHEDHIVLSIEGAEDVLKSHRESIFEATRARPGSPKSEPHTLDLDGITVTIRFEKA